MLKNNFNLSTVNKILKTFVKKEAKNPSLQETLKLIEENFHIPILSNKQNSFHCFNFAGHSGGVDKNPSALYSKKTGKITCMACGMVMRNNADVIMEFLWTSYQKWTKLKNSSNQTFKYNSKIKGLYNKEFNISKTTFEMIKELNKLYDFKNLFKEIDENFENKTQDFYKLLKLFYSNSDIYNLMQLFHKSFFGIEFENKNIYEDKYIYPKNKAKELKEFLGNDKKYQNLEEQFIQKYKNEARVKNELTKEILNIFYKFYLGIWDERNIKNKLNNIKLILENYGVEEKNQEELLKIFKKRNVFNKKQMINNYILKELKLENDKKIKLINEINENMKIKPSKEFYNYWKSRGFENPDWLFEKKLIVDIQHEFMPNVFNYMKGVSSKIAKEKLNDLYNYPTYKEYLEIINNYYKNLGYDTIRDFNEENLKESYKDLLNQKPEINLNVLNINSENKSEIYKILNELNTLKNKDPEQYKSELLKKLSPFVINIKTKPEDIVGIKLLENINFFLKGNLSLRNHRLLIPFFDENKNIVHLEGRLLPSGTTIKEDKEYYIVKTQGGNKVLIPKSFRFMTIGNKTLYGLELLNNSNYLIVVEGQTDANTLQYLGFNAISFPGVNTMVDKSILDKLYGKNILILSDNDEPGKLFGEKLSNILNQYSEVLDENGKVPNLYLKDKETIKDINDYFSTYGTQKTKEFIDNLLKEYKLEQKENNKKIEPVKLDNNINLYKTTNNIALGINTNYLSSNNKQYLGKFKDITEYIKNNNIKVFSINENGLYEYNKYVEWAKENNKKILLTTNFKILDEEGTLIFNDVEDMKKFIEKHPDKKLDIKDIYEYSKKTKIILPLRYNKQFFNLKENKLNKDNIYIGVPSNYIYKSKYIPSNISFKPVFINTNKYINSEDYVAYKVSESIKNKRNFNLTKILQDANNNEINNYDLYDLNKLKEKFEEFYNSKFEKLNNNNNELNKLNKEYERSKKIISNIYNFTVEEIDNISKKFGTNIKYEVKLKLHDELLLTKRQQENFNKLSKLEKNKMLLNQFKYILNYLIFPSKRKKFEEVIPEWIKNNKLLFKRVNENLDEIEKNEPDKYKEIINRIKEEINILKEADNVEKFENNPLYTYIIEDLYSITLGNTTTGVGRGSAAGSYINYILGITKINPMKYGLLMERFLNKGRVKKGAMPDIDTDISKTDKENIEKELYANFPKTTGYIENEITWTKKKIFLDIIKYSGLTFNKETIKELSKINKLLDIDEKKWEKKIYEYLKINGIEDKIIQEILKVIGSLEGEISKFNKHVSAFVIGKNMKYLSTKGIDENSGIPIYSVTQSSLENFGEKFDFLSSKQLEAIKEFENKYSKEFNIKDLKYDVSFLEENYFFNKDFFKEILNGNDNIEGIQFEGIFQLDSQNRYRFLKEKLWKIMEIDNIEEISNYSALIRPGTGILKPGINQIEQTYIMNSKKFKNNSTIQNLKKEDIQKINKILDNSDINKYDYKFNYYFNYLKENGVEINNLSRLENLLYETVKDNPYYDIKINKLNEIETNNNKEYIKTIITIYNKLIQDFPQLKDFIKTTYDLNNLFKLIEYKTELERKKFLTKHLKNIENKYQNLFDNIITNQDFDYLKNTGNFLIETKKSFDTINNDNFLKSILRIKDINKLTKEELLKSIKKLQDIYYMIKLEENYTYNKITQKDFKTNGILLFQEQIMNLIRNGIEKNGRNQINRKYNIKLDSNIEIKELLNNNNINDNIKKELNNIKDFALEEQTDIIKAISKKNDDVMMEKEELILKSLEANGLDKKTSEYLWNIIKLSSEYSFNASHSISYSVPILYTLAIKYKYPLIFELLNNNIMGKQPFLSKKYTEGGFILEHPLANISEKNKNKIYKLNGKDVIVPPLSKIEKFKNNLGIIDTIKNQIEPVKSFSDFMNKKKEKNLIEISYSHINELINNFYFIEIVDQYLINYIKKNKDNFKKEVILKYEKIFNQTAVNGINIKNELS